VSTVEADRRFPRAGEVWQSRDRETAGDRADVVVEGGAGASTVR
jgi:hypothetical protein